MLKKLLMHGHYEGAVKLLQHYGNMRNPLTVIASCVKGGDGDRGAAPGSA